MSLDVDLYVENVDDSLIPLWIDKLNQLGMKCEIHPDFSFENHFGFLPFKIELYDSQQQDLLNDEFITGFELCIDDFNLDHEIEESKANQNSLNNALSRESSKVNYVNPEIDEKLKKCKKKLTFIWGSADIFEFRMAILSCATLAVLTNGVCYSSSDDIWFDNNTIVEDCLKGVLEYENSFTSNELKVYKFEKWL